jgi:hypothetical protein
MGDEDVAIVHTIIAALLVSRSVDIFAETSSMAKSKWPGV